MFFHVLTSFAMMWFIPVETSLIGSRPSDKYASYPTVKLTLLPSCASVSRFPQPSRGRCYFRHRIVWSATNPKARKITNPNLDPCCKEISFICGATPKEPVPCYDINCHYSGSCPISIKCPAHPISAETIHLNARTQALCVVMRDVSKDNCFALSVYTMWYH